MQHLYEFAACRAVGHERALWLGVIDQAFHDATGAVSSLNGKGREVQRTRLQKEALQWFFCDNRDFRFVCLAAGVEPALVRECVQKKLGRRGA